jgi:ClpX C4-type zinc finger
MAEEIAMSDVRCSWCWKGAGEVAVLIEGQRGAYICDECAELCAEIAHDKKAGRAIGATRVERGIPKVVAEALARLENLTAGSGGERRPPPLPQSSGLRHRDG